MKDKLIGRLEFARERIYEKVCSKLGGTPVVYVFSCQEQQTYMMHP